jgi:hypothetical protein
MYLEEMEVHSRLGIRIRVISPKALFETLQSANSIALYGRTVALHFHGTHLDLGSGELYLMFDSDRICDVGRDYEEIYRLSISWSAYKATRKLSYSDEESGISVFNRKRYLELRLES